MCIKIFKNPSVLDENMHAMDTDNNYLSHNIEQ